jgi:hypothetical protein
MSKLGYSPKLLREFVRFARENKVYWIVPLAVVLGLFAMLTVASQVVAPLVYTLF